MHVGKTLVIAITCAALAAPAAEARPRLFKMLRALGGPVAIIAGVAGARAYHRRVASTPRRDAAPSSVERTVIVAGWSGPLFWPYAYHDIFDYVFAQPDGANRFWSRGYGDVLNGMFVSASVSDPRTRGTRLAQSSQNGADSSNGSAVLEGMCASQSPNAAAALAERIRATVMPTPQQIGSFNVLKDALTRANARVQTACPNAPAFDATNRLGLMAMRLMAMRQALSLVLPPLRKFYAMLSDEQKVRLDGGDPNALAGTEPSRVAAASGAVGCSDADDVGDWPTARIARQVAPKGEQLQGLEILRQTSAALGTFVATTCAAGKVQTAPERLDAAMQRLNVLRYAVTHVRPALDEFYEALSPAQKARFASLGR